MQRCIYFSPPKRTFAKQEQHAKHAPIFEKTSPSLDVSLKVKHNEIRMYFYLVLGALVGVTYSVH